MNRILLFCALGALWGCRQAAELSGEAITLSCSTSESSKVGALTAGDAVAVFARLDETETYFLEGAKFTTGSDGKTLSKSPAVYYPEVQQAVNFYAYFPYHTGSFSVPSDQSTAAALKQADLCWATTKSTPISMVPLTFEHQMARLIVQTNEPTSKIACMVVPSGVLNAATAQFTLNGGKREVFTTGSELILPVQPLTRLVLTVSGIEYIYEGSINLQAGQTTTLNLTLHPNTKTATLNGSSTTKWTTSNKQGTPEQTVSNVLTLHWANYVPQGATPDKIIMTIGGTDYTISSGITYANKTFTVPFASNTLRYPYTISKIAFSDITLPCTHLLGEVIYKSGTQTVGIKDVPNAVKIGDLWWGIGNLIADGPNGCKIGLPTDDGVRFHFGSLVGWTGGANGNGIGIPSISLAAAIKVKPSNYVGSTSWPAGYFVGGPVSTGYNLPTTDNTATGIGDPCRFYLGNNWHTPTADEFKTLFGSATEGLSWPQGGFNWQSSPAGANKSSEPQLFFPATGLRNGYGVAYGNYQDIGVRGCCWTSSALAGDVQWGKGLDFTVSTVSPNGGYWRYHGLSVRCVTPAN